MIRDKSEEIVSYFRHPLSYLVEASDDICYMLMDLEDAVKLEIISLDEAVRMLYPIIKYYYEEK
jgi:dGTPase